MAPLVVPAAGKTGFTLLAATTTGIVFTNQLAEARHLTNQILLNGSGVAAGDVDGDGQCDLFFCGLDSPNALYRNLGHWKFQDLTVAAGVAGPGWDATGAAFADVDGDGDLDLIVNTMIQGTHVFFNDGHGRFVESEKNRGLNTGNAGTSLTLADIDGDGDLDLYLANYRPVTIRDQPNTPMSIGMVNGQPVVKLFAGRPLTDPDLTNRFSFRVVMTDTGGSVTMDEHGQADRLCLNDGQGRFTPVSWADGRFRDERGQPLAHPPFDWGLTASFRDLNGDGAPDLYVCNDFKSPDRIWLNDGRGYFRALPALAIRQICLSSMGMDFADLDRDGYEDILVLDMLSRDHHRRFTQRIDIKPEVLPIGAIDNRPQYSRNMLLRHRGDGTYAEIAQVGGLEASEWSWMPAFLDVDLDGLEDVLIPNGFERDNMNMDVVQLIEAQKKQRKLSNLELMRLRKQFPRLATANLAFRNLGQWRFADMSQAWGFAAPTLSQGLALADLDNDGDLDVVVNNLNSGAGVYRNDSAAPRLAVRLKGQGGNTRGIGANLKVLGGPMFQSQQMVAGGRYLSGDDPMRVFAAGQAASLTLEVAWRSGKQSRLTNALPNHLYELDEALAVAPAGAPPAKPPVEPVFKEVSARWGHAHHEDPFDDFARQPLLPHRLSQTGPGVAWFDLDGDGWDDLLIGGGRGGQLAVFRNDRQGGFQKQAFAPFNELLARDQTGLVAWRKPDGQAVVLIGSSNYEDGETNGSVARRYDWAARKIEEPLPGHESSAGPLALADMDGDGWLDLFVGGRVVPGHYAEPASSLVFRNRQGQFTLDVENTRTLAKIGLVSGAVFSDLDGDGAPDLVLACEWGPVRLYRNAGGKLVEATAALGLDKCSGWWNGVTTGDFDGDGRLDIAAANWGRNTKYESFRAEPLRLYCGDLDGNGVTDVIEAVFDPAWKQLVPFQPFHLIGPALPVIREQVGTFEAYARATLQEIYGERLKQTLELQANWLETTVFLNRGDHFEPRLLPFEAQLSPAFAVCVGDLDGDGLEDLFLSQNFFAVTVETSRYDAGRGLWLRGDGQGGFMPVPGQESGFLVYGEQRGAALGDYDADGRLDVVVTQNAAETKLYHNERAKPGLRVRLIGPPGNPHGVGAVLRLGNGGRLGPAREIHAGSGYFSQDSVVQVLTGPAPADRLWIRWPGGKSATVNLPPGAKEIAVDTSGTVKTLRP